MTTEYVLVDRLSAYAGTHYGQIISVHRTIERAKQQYDQIQAGVLRNYGPRNYRPMLICSRTRRARREGWAYCLTHKVEWP